MRTVELTPRLRSVAELVPRGARFADVGTDHAYLPVWLLQQGRITGAVASDLRPGPLERARGTAEKYGLMPSGGSDFHGENKPDIRLGTGRGALNVPDEWYEALREAAEKA